MRFELSDEHREIGRVARELLAARAPLASLHEIAGSGQYDDALWREMVALGWPGIAVAEEHGGQGLGAIGLVVLLEELGYACAGAPLLPTAVAAAAIEACGDREQRTRWLPGLAGGESTAGIGSRELAADADGAAVAVLIDGDRAEIVPTPTTEAFRTIDPARRFSTVRGEGEPLGPGAADLVRAAIAAELVGVCQRALDMTVTYVKQRSQFGVAVGSFQAVSHRCAEMLLHTESARSAVYFAAWAADADRERLHEAAALAAAAAAEAGRVVTGSAIQAHGGIGFTWEADVHWLYKRAQLDIAMLGGARRHLIALGRLAAARPSAREPEERVGPAHVSE
jgi:alkylation response protein AidB-like acyl-CoA dehydrogenase